ncbi:MAG: hypothetical protein Kow0068_21620 [Marinilabiliales bacterium]
MILDDKNVESDTSSTGGNKTENENQTDIIYIKSVKMFIDSVKNSLDDTLICYDWINDDIHIRKFDFSEMTDTFPIPLIVDDNDYHHPVKNKVTSGFGVRRWQFHYGIDLDLNTGDSVYNTFNGIVRVSTYSKSYGNVVVVRQQNGLESLYAHLSKRLVAVDSVLKAGDVVGLGGNTGWSFGSHLHYELRFFDEALDPTDIIDFENYKLYNDTLYLTSCNFAYRELIKDLERIRFHIVQPGNTLSHIAVWYGTTVSALCRLNGISPNKILQIGERIRVR